ncbi:hypothetical protein M408DRAFT_171709 [Serendipita vermifera MAFF 305830]|uniref:Protein kinase domain-containing protein n=1 Tax=Serendipita vermifera MAFF 305830 TaxID=933852 RepID=A0A0C2XDU8_SERVB|nr:hypothetical protein M408DRAFT_171709 [Serendipita vermifera MAFF 305830]
MGALGAMVSPYYVNGSAADYFARATLTYYNKLTLWLEVLQGMAYLHGYYPIIVHGDLKPQNILIDDTGHARICDFGLARLILERGSTGLTTTTAHAGTDRYKAPELVIKPNAKPTVASDVYALGCIGLEFVLSQRPYWQHSVVWKILEDIRGGKPPASRPRDLSPEIGYFWDQLQACWDEEPTERPTTTSLCYYISNYSISLADELEKVQDQESQ